MRPSQEKAIATLRKTIGKAPRDARTRFELGNLLRDRGKTDEAIASYREAVALDPGHAPAQSSLALLLAGKGLIEESLPHFEKAIAVDPRSSQGHHNLGTALHRIGRNEEAMKCFRAALRISPSASTYDNLGLLHVKLGQFEEAVRCHREAIKLAPKLAEAHCNLGSAHVKLEQFEEGARCFRRAVELKPDFAMAHNNMGLAYLGLEQPEKAIASCRRALELNPARAEWHYNLANCHWEILDLVGASRSYEKAIELAPENPKYHWNYALTLLTAGDYAKGWREYDWRWEGSSDLKESKPDYPQPQWEGGDIAGKTVLLYAEQGFGDALHFVRYAPMVAARGANVVLACQKSLARLLASVEGVQQVVEMKRPAAADFVCPLLSLPRLFDTTLATIPATVPYIKADPELVATWRKRMKPDAALKVGLIWAGAPKNRADVRRSLELSAFAPLGKIPGVHFYSLQKGPQAAATKSPPAGMRLTDWTAEIEDFADTAALMSNLDLLISVDTAGVHLAGAMGKPVWMLNRYKGDWRWLLDRDDSPWYPALRIFRQPQPGEWQPVIDQVTAALTLLASQRLALTHGNLAVQLAGKGRLEEALPYFEKAVAADPRSSRAHHNLGTALHRAGRHKEAIEHLNTALQINPSAETYDNLGLAHASLQVALDEACRGYEKAIELAPDNAEYHWNYALALLAAGDYAKGWREYEWRWKGSKVLTGTKPDYRQPQWNGEDIAGKTVLLYPEQGYGDAIHFARYVPMVAARGAKVVLACQKPLARLLASVEGVREVVDRQQRPAVDYTCPLLSLPLVFGTTLDTIPAAVPYIKPDPARAAAWRKRMKPDNTLKVGLIWAGAPKNRADARRSLELSAFAPLGKIPGVHFYSLQKGPQAAATKSPPAGMKLTDWTAEIEDFADTAALMSNLDLLISVDTAGVHLAGAMGKPVWMLNRYKGDWRWLLDREDNPWYPTLRIFRQPQPGEWAPVINSVAEALYRKLLAAGPKPSLYLGLADALKAQGKGDEAVDAHRKAIELRPKDARLRHNLGCLLREQGKADAAVECFREAVALDPGLAASHLNLGITLGELARHEEASQSYRRIIELQPGRAEAHAHLANALMNQQRFEEAVPSWNKAVELEPSNHLWHYSLGNCCRCALQLDDSIAAYRRAIPLKPSEAKYHLNHSISLLLAGRYPEGWTEYEWRWRVPAQKGTKPDIRPEWNGENLSGKTLLLHWEQGLGDTLHFVRYAPLLAARGAKVVLACQPALARLMRGVKGVHHVVATGQSVSGFDYFCPLLSLPRLLGTTLANLPASIPYIQADPALAAAWRKRMEPDGMLKVGLIWGGSVTNLSDKRRSVPLADLAPLAKVPGVRLYSLQKGPYAAEAKSLPAGMTLIDWTGEISDFADSAALMANLDLLISVDTAGVHLAGAMGKPVWMLNRQEGDWRWLLDREDSPWYPTVRIFRQARRDDWQPVIEKVAEALAGMARRHDAQAPDANDVEGTAREAAASFRSRDYARAEALLRDLVTRAPSAARHANLAEALKAQGKNDDAIASYHAAVRLEPGDSRLRMSVGNLLAAQGRPGRAIYHYRKALALKPDLVAALSNIANTLCSIDRFGKSLPFHRRLLELDAADPEAINRAAFAYTRAQCLDEAIAAYERALALTPESATCHWNYAVALLMVARFERGWKEYEWRWTGSPESARWKRSVLSSPRWNGEDLAGKTIVLHCEQGLGDTIQFIRYARLVAARGARVVVLCPAALARLVGRAPGVSQVVTSKKRLPPHDLHCPLLSLPLAFNTTLATIPGATPYLEAEPGPAAAWRKRIGVSKAVKVGLVWGGNEANLNDVTRSIALAALAPLARVEGTQFYSLQKGSYAAQAKSPPAGMALTDWMGEIDDLADTAALVANLDLVISVDTAPAHLAGAMGKPVWLLNRYESEWRWMLGREDSPWYPTMRIFRQPQPGNWVATLEKVATELRVWARDKS